MNRGILSKQQKNLWEKIAGAKWLEPFYLAGGTALALHLAHRESIDLDFFTQEKSAIEGADRGILDLQNTRIENRDGQTINAMLLKVRTSFFYYPYPLLEEFTVFEGIKVAGIGDIAAMKIVEVSQRGTKKDLIDIHAILKSGWNIESIFQSIESKYKNISYNKIHLLKSLIYFEDAQGDPMPRMLRETSWKEVKRELTAFCAKKVLR